MAGNWIHRLFNPHCPSCHDEMICESCETLKMQLEIVNHEKQKLLDKLLAPPVMETVAQPVREITAPVNIPWAVRRQILEREDREKAKLIREAPVPITTEELEKELDVATSAREIKSK
jgi:hypothetical protein